MKLAVRLSPLPIWLFMALLLWTGVPYAAIPRPMEVQRALFGLWATQGLGPELWSSMWSNLHALTITCVISLLVSYATVLPFFRPLATIISKGRFLGLTGLTFLFTLVFGGGHALKVSLLVFGMSVFFVTSMAATVQGIPQSKFEYARTLRMGSSRVFWETVVLGTIPQAFEALRQNAAIGWMMLTMTEGLARSEGGVGAMLLNQSKHFHLSEVFAIQAAVLVVGMLQDYSIGLAKQFCCPYAVRPLERM